MSLESFILTLLTSGLVSGVVSAIVAGGFQLRAERLTRRNEHWIEARTALKDLEVAYIKVREGDLHSDELLEVQAQFKEKVDTCAHKPLTKASKVLLDVGPLHAAGDQDNGIEPFEAAVDGVRTVIRSRLSGIT